MSIPAALQLDVNPAAGKIRCSRSATVLSRDGEQLSTRDGERSLYQYFSSVQGLGGFQDHFDWYVDPPPLAPGGVIADFNSFVFIFLLLIYPCVPTRWASHTFSIRGGKPLWVDPFDRTVQHIFIDDNIRQNDDDTIVHPKVCIHSYNHSPELQCIMN